MFGQNMKLNIISDKRIFIKITYFNELFFIGTK